MQRMDRTLLCCLLRGPISSIFEVIIGLVPFAVYLGLLFDDFSMLFCFVLLLFFFLNTSRSPFMRVVFKFINKLTVYVYLQAFGPKSFIRKGKVAKDDWCLLQTRYRP